MNCMVFPWISYLEVQKAQVIDMGDIEYLAIKEFDGKLIDNDGTLSVLGDLCTLTASVGKDMYLATAKVNVFMAANNQGGQTVTCTLNVNGIIRETFSWFGGTNAGGTNGDNGDNYEFDLKGIKVTTGQIIKLEVTSIGSGMGINGIISAFEEDTGATPQIPPL